VTVPDTPRTIRKIVGWFSRIGMKSVTVIEPDFVFMVVSSTRVPSMYLRVMLVTGSVGRTVQCPLLSSPSSDANAASESSRGKHNQSIAPARDTSAEVWRSPMSA